MPRSRRFDPLRHGSDELPGDPSYTDNDDDDDGFAWEERLGMHVCEDNELGGWDRPAEIVENEDDIEMQFEALRQPVIQCGYCGDRLRTRSKAKALRWFHAHPCPPLETSEAAGIIYDLGPLTRDNASVAA